MIACKRCGQRSGDDVSFCGVCGAYLPWDGEPVVEHATPLATPEPAPEPALAPEPEAEPALRAPAPEAAQPPPEPVSEASAAAPTLPCPSCGKANEPTRRFCHRCGATLAAQPGTEAPERHAEQVAGVVAQAREVLESVGPRVVKEHLERTFERLEHPTATVTVVGEFKTGKSTLINALLGTTVCPADDIVATTVPTIVRWGETAGATVVLGADDATSHEQRELDVSVADVAHYATESGGALAYTDGDPVHSVDVRVNRRILEAGLQLVDTPGFDGLQSGLAELVLASLAASDALLFVTDALQELTAAEVDFLHSAASRCPQIACVVTKIDLSPQWRRLVDIDGTHLAAAGLDVPIFPVSSFLRLRAASTRDAEMHHESGFPPLLSYLASGVVPARRDAEAATAAGDVERLSTQLTVPLKAERDALADPAAAPVILADMGRAQEHVTRLATAGATWQQTLRDGMLDLSSDVQHDLHERLRTLLQQADELIDRSDPKENADELHAWATRQVAHQVVGTFDVLSSKTGELAAQVSAHFAADLPLDLLGPAVRAPDHVLDAVGFDLRARDARPRRTESVLTAARGTYSGAMMLGFAANLIALPLALPATIAAGAALGGKALRDERRRQVDMRRLDARRAIQRYVERVAAIADKDLRDALRQTERRLRDAFQNLALGLIATTGDALQTVERAAHLDDTARRSRLETVDQQLAGVTDVRERAAALAS